MEYFISQVALAAASFGIDDHDIEIVIEALVKTFAYKRLLRTEMMIEGEGPQLQSICLADGGPIVPMNASCADYPIAVEPAAVNSTLAVGKGNGTSNGTISSRVSSGTVPGGISSAPTVANAAGIAAAGVFAIFAMWL